MAKILVLNGPNVGLIGLREPHLYGTDDLETTMQRLRERAQADGVELEVLTSNHEGVLVDRVHEVVRAKADGSNDVTAALVNPGGLTAYGISLLDALIAAELDVVEVHVSNRFRKNSDEKRGGFDLERDLLAKYAIGQVLGLGVMGYDFGLEWLLANGYGAPAGGSRAR